MQKTLFIKAKNKFQAKINENNPQNNNTGSSSASVQPLTKTSANSGNSNSGRADGKISVIDSGFQKSVKSSSSSVCFPARKSTNSAKPNNVRASGNKNSDDNFKKIKSMFQQKIDDNNPLNSHPKSRCLSQTNTVFTNSENCGRNYGNNRQHNESGSLIKTSSSCDPTTQSTNPRNPNNAYNNGNCDNDVPNNKHVSGLQNSIVEISSSLINKHTSNDNIIKSNNGKFHHHDISDNNNDVGYCKRNNNKIDARLQKSVVEISSSSMNKLTSNDNIVNPNHISNNNNDVGKHNNSKIDSGLQKSIVEFSSSPMYEPTHDNNIIKPNNEKNHEHHISGNKNDVRLENSILNSALQKQTIQGINTFTFYQDQEKCDINATFEKIEEIHMQVLKLKNDVEYFNGTCKDKYIYFREMLTRNLFNLDNIESDGNQDIILKKRETIKIIQDCINNLKTNTLECEELEDNKIRKTIQSNYQKNITEELMENKHTENLNNDISGTKNKPVLNISALQNQTIQGGNTSIFDQETYDLHSTFEKIKKIQIYVLELKNDVENFKGTRKDKNYIYLDEMLTRYLLNLDNIESNGNQNIILRKREIIKLIQDFIKNLKENAFEFEKLEENKTRITIQSDCQNNITENINNDRPNTLTDQNNTDSELQNYQKNNCHSVPKGPPPQTKTCAEAQENQLSQFNIAVEKIELIRADVIDLYNEVNDFKSTPNNKNFNYLIEMLTRNLLELDNIESSGCNDIRLKKRGVIGFIQNCISKLEENAIEK